MQCSQVGAARGCYARQSEIVSIVDVLMIRVDSKILVLVLRGSSWQLETNSN